jgi:hypothetical protein
VRLQIKLVYIYMYCVNHENRYFLDRMTHIIWVLATLVFIQFHLMHMSSFSFVSAYTLYLLFTDHLHVRINSFYIGHPQKPIFIQDKRSFFR